MDLNSNHQRGTQVPQGCTRVKVRAGTTYQYDPVGMDVADPPVGRPSKGDLLTVVNLNGCPKANTMEHCHVNDKDGRFAGLVSTNSLKKVRKIPKRLTMRWMNEVLREKYGPDVEFVHGEGYFYFIDLRDGGYDSESIYTFHLNNDPAYCTAYEWWMSQAADFYDRDKDIWIGN